MSATCTYAHPVATTGCFDVLVNTVESTYQHSRRVIENCGLTRQWGAIADTLTEDGVYRRSGLPPLVGREAVREHFEAIGEVLPGTLLDRIQLVWHSVDEANLRAVCQVKHVLRDPGDGSEHFALSMSTLLYGREGLWSQVIDHFNPDVYRAMYRNWARAARRAGTSGVDPIVLEALEGAVEIEVRPIDGRALRTPTVLG